LPWIPGARMKLTVLLPALMLPLLTLPVSPTSAAPASIASLPVSRMETPAWKHRFEQKQAELKGPVDLLWLGDSITQDWEHAGPEPWRDFAPAWRRFYGDRHAVNLGFKGDSTCHLLWRLQHGELDDIHPKAAILLIGANNFGHIHTDAAQTYKGIVTVLDVLHRRLPTMRVLLIGVLPSIRSSWVSTNTKLLNQHLATLPASEGPWLHYVDASSIFEDHGEVDPRRFIDPRLTPPDPPLHPTAAAQAALAAMIEPRVASMMGDHQHR